MLKKLSPILMLTGICWVILVVNNVLLGGAWGGYGIVPRRLSSLPAVVWAPFLHGSFRHLAANSLPLLVLGGVLCARSTREFAAVTLAGMLLGGGLTWLFGRHASHIGASGLIFCYFGYLASLAWFQRNFVTVCLSVLCLVGFGGILKGILPASSAVSWEAHLAGLLVGIGLAWLLSKRNKTSRIAPDLAHSSKV